MYMNMKKNVGIIDRVIKVILGLVIFAIGYWYQTWWGLIGIIPFVTGILGSCAIYSMFGISTNKKADKTTETVDTVQEVSEEVK